VDSGQREERSEVSFLLRLILRLNETVITTRKRRCKVKK
jgi:hypothetical protein